MAIKSGKVPQAASRGGAEKRDGARLTPPLYRVGGVNFGRRLQTPKCTLRHFSL